VGVAGWTEFKLHCYLYQAALSNKHHHNNSDQTNHQHIHIRTCWAQSKLPEDERSRDACSDSDPAVGRSDSAMLSRLGCVSRRPGDRGPPLCAVSSGGAGASKPMRICCALGAAGGRAVVPLMDAMDWLRGV